MKIVVYFLDRYSIITLSNQLKEDYIMKITQEQIAKAKATYEAAYEAAVAATEAAANAAYKAAVDALYAADYAAFNAAYDKYIELKEKFENSK